MPDTTTQQPAPALTDAAWSAEQLRAFITSCRETLAELEASGDRRFSTRAQIASEKKAIRWGEKRLEAMGEGYEI